MISLNTTNPTYHGYQFVLITMKSIKPWQSKVQVANTPSMCGPFRRATSWNRWRAILVMCSACTSHPLPLHRDNWWVPAGTEPWILEARSAKVKCQQDVEAKCKSQLHKYYINLQIYHSTIFTAVYIFTKVSLFIIFAIGCSWLMRRGLDDG